MIIKDKHRKHPKLKRPAIGNYHRCEWAIYGTTCSEISSFFELADSYLNGYSLLYVDADHGEKKNQTFSEVGKKQFLKREVAPFNDFDDKLIAHNADAVFVNGNHYPASRQIVFLNEDKKDSLKRREDQLTNIDILIKSEADQPIYDFLSDKISDSTVIYDKSSFSEVLQNLELEIKSARPVLKALILAGGKSQRMGHDKAELVYHKGMSQEAYLTEMLEEIGLDVYVSKGFDSNDNNDKVIKDRLPNMGPFGAIISAMMTDPDCAWLVIACDLPFVDNSLITNLIESRNSSKYATAIRGVENRFPEPLIAIYEPRSYSRFLSFLSLGYACPRKVLINSEIAEVIVSEMNVIANVNTPEEKAEALKQINH